MFSFSNDKICSFSLFYIVVNKIFRGFKCWLNKTRGLRTSAGGFLGIVMGNFHDFMTFYERLIDQLKRKTDILTDREISPTCNEY